MGFGGGVETFCIVLSIPLHVCRGSVLNLTFTFIILLDVEAAAGRIINSKYNSSTIYYTIYSNWTKVQAVVKTKLNVPLGCFLKANSGYNLIIHTNLSQLLKSSWIFCNNIPCSLKTENEKIVFIKRVYTEGTVFMKPAYIVYNLHTINIIRRDGQTAFRP